MPITTIIALLGGVAGALSALAYILRAATGWRQSGASERDKLIKSATDLAGELREDVVSVRAENKQVKAENRQLNTTIAALEAQFAQFREQTQRQIKELQQRVRELEHDSHLKDMRIEEVEAENRLLREQQPPAPPKAS